MKSSLFLLMVTIISQMHLISANVQSLQLCYNSDCTDAEVIRSNVRDINQIIPKGKTVEKVCSVESAWIVFEKIDFEGDSREVSGSRSCYSSYKILSFRHLGNVETHKSGLSLYEDDEFEGGELYFEGDSLQLPEPFSMKSHCFTGIDRWELNQGEQFNGRSKCLQIREDSSYELPKCERNDPLQGINSIGRGCHLEASRTNPLVHPANPIRQKANIVSAPHITFFTEENQQGKRLYIDGMVLRLTKPYTFESYKFKGNWQTFSGINFDGNSTCLNRKSEMYWSNAEGGFSQGTKELEVGSVKRGCGHPINEDDDDDDDDDDDETSSASVNKAYLIFLPAFLLVLHK